MVLHQNLQDVWVSLVQSHESSSHYCIIEGVQELLVFTISAVTEGPLYPGFRSLEEVDPCLLYPL